MNGIPGPILNKLRKTLFECGPFDSDHQLRSAFTDDRIAAWKNIVPEANNRRDRVGFFVNVFHDRYNRTGQNVLVLFLQVLYDQQNPEDECLDRLYDIAIEIAAVVKSNLPPLSHYNIVRASEVRAGKISTENFAGYIPPTIESDLRPFFVTLPTTLSEVSFTEQLESLKNKQRADWLPVNFLEKGVRAASAVGRVEYQGKKIGTAFLVSPDLVLTNAHVVREIRELVKGGVRFNVGLELTEQWRHFAKQIVVSPVEELDFALLCLEAPATGSSVTFSQERAYNKQPANILQHPKGGLMQVALRYNTIIYTDTERFYYVADTEEGSSGSPIFNDDWQVIGLHRAGIVNNEKRPIKNANQGVPFLAIKPFIQSYL